MCRKVVILAGGLGSRLKPFTEVIPKALLPIGEKAILEIQIEYLKKFDFNDIIIATNYKSDYIKNFFGDGSRYGVKLTISKEDKPLGTAGPLKLLQDQIKEPFLVMNGDVLSLMNFADFFSFALKIDSSLTLSIKKIITPYAFGNIIFHNDYVTAIEEKPDIIRYAMTGMYVMKPEIFELIPENQYFGMDSLINLMISKNLPVAKYEMDKYWIDIGRVEDYNKVQEDFKRHFATIEK